MLNNCYVHKETARNGYTNTFICPIEYYNDTPNCHLLRFLKEGPVTRKQKANKKQTKTKQNKTKQNKNKQNKTKTKTKTKKQTQKMDAMKTN